MTPLERFGTDTDAVWAAIEAQVRSLVVALPTIVSQDSDGHNVNSHPAINSIVRSEDGTMTQVPWPELQTMVAHFSGGGQVTETHPIKQKDEGLVLFISRAIDSFRQNGGIQNPVDSRQHHASDSVYIGGIKSDPNKIKNVAPDSMQHRSLDAKVTHDVHPTNGITHKVVPASDPSTNPFNDATSFFQTVHNAASGIVKTATDGTLLHTLSHTLQGILGSVTGGSANHTFSCTVSDGPTLIGQLGGLISKVLVQPGNLQLTASNAISLSAPNLSLPSGGVASDALAPNAASDNVGALGGGLSGTLPDPNLVIENPFVLCNLPGYANNAAAIAAGVLPGQMYVNLSISAGEFVVCQAH